MTLSEAGRCDLLWVESRHGRWAYDLLAGDEAIGHLFFATDSGSRAIGEIDGQRWTFEHHESSQPQVIVRDELDPEPLATFTQRWTGAAVVKFRNGSEFFCQRSHVWSTTYCFRRNSRKGSVCISQEAPAKPGSRVTICGEAIGMAETPVLVVLGWYVEILMAERFVETAVAW